MGYTANINNIHVARYVTALREGGSMPAIVEADDGMLYVLKFSGAGQGTKALIAELIGGEIARILGLRIPEIVIAQLDAAFGRSEGDEEIQDLLKASVGLNLGLHYLPGALTFDPAVTSTRLNAKLASQIVWLDTFILNLDRTARNTNMLWWNNELWLIDHGAALFFQHSWRDWEQRAQQPFAEIKNHVLLPQAALMPEVDREFRRLLTKEIVHNIVSLIPNEWIRKNSSFESIDDQKKAYARFLELRLDYSENFAKDIQNAR